MNPYRVQGTRVKAAPCIACKGSGRDWNSLYDGETDPCPRCEGEGIEPPPKEIKAAS